MVPSTSDEGISVNMKAYKLKQWLKVARVQTAMVTALALWIGFVTVESLDAYTFVWLGIIGLLIHVWGFMLNEVYDYEYDVKYGDTHTHPIARGDVCKHSAVKVAWLSGIIAFIISTIVFKSMLGNTFLVLSFGAGLAYNKYSKKHWWSNAYLSAWVLFITLAGASFAGQFSEFSWMLGIALAIQIFVQVIEGDMKDLVGPEKCMAKRAGVTVNENTNVIRYPPGFRRAINGLKMLELVLVSYVVYSNFRFIPQDYFAIMLFGVFASVFVATSTMFMTARLDRDRIKEMSSVHELTSILMIGVSTYWLHFNSAIFISFIPVLWYVLVNKTIHSGSINPDI